MRERAPYRDSVDLGDLSASEWRDYAAICGRSLAQAHGLSDEAGVLDYDLEPAVLASAGPPELFSDDLLRFGTEACARIRGDFEHFRADHALGAFRCVDVVYR